MSASAIYRITFVVCLIFRIEFPLCHGDKDLNDYGREKKTIQQCFGTCFHFSVSDVTNTKVRNQFSLRKEIIENQKTNVQTFKRSKPETRSNYVYKFIALEKAHYVCHKV